MIRTTKPARAWRRSMHPARCAPAAGMAMATCAATVHPRAGRPAPTSRICTPSRAALCRVPCGGSSRRRNDASTDLSTFRPGAGGCRNPGAAVAAPGDEDQQPNQNAAAFAVAQAAAWAASLQGAMPRSTGLQGQCHETSEGPRAVSSARLRQRLLHRAPIPAITEARMDMPCWICSIVRLAYPRISPADRGRSCNDDGANSGPTG